MLLQSHAGVIDLLPALPTAWPDGSVNGLRARGGITVDLRWRSGALVEATFRADSEQDASIRIGSHVEAIRLESGSEKKIVHPNPA